MTTIVGGGGGGATFRTVARVLSGWASGLRIGATLGSVVTGTVKSPNKGHFCPLFRGCPYLGGSIVYSSNNVLIINIWVDNQ